MDFINLIDKNISQIVDLHKNNYININDYLLFLFKYYNNINIPIYNSSFNKFLTFIKISYYLITSQHKNIFERVFDIYYYKGNFGNRIISSNYTLPFKKPIPFTFGYIKNKKYKLILSNVYYYEINIGPPFRDPWLNMSLSIGFGQIDNVLSGIKVGQQENSIGIHNNGDIFYNNFKIANSFSFTSNDTIGAGVIYKGNNNYEVFFTKNGKFIGSKLITFLNKFIIQIGYNCNCPIKFNYGNNEFKYDFSKHIKIISLSTKNNIVSDDTYSPIVSNFYDFNPFLIYPHNSFIDQTFSPIE